MVLCRWMQTPGAQAPLLPTLTRWAHAAVTLAVLARLWVAYCTPSCSLPCDSVAAKHVWRRKYAGSTTGASGRDYWPAWSPSEQPSVRRLYQSQRRQHAWPWWTWTGTT